MSLSAKYPTNGLSGPRRAAGRRTARHLPAVTLAVLFLLAAVSALAESGFSTNGRDGENRGLVSPRLPPIFISEADPGFRSGTRIFGLSAGAAYGLLILGGEERHHLALISASYGRVIGDVVGKGKWYQGHLELRAELFGGTQFNSPVRAITGLTPHLRYHFITGTRIVPYIDAGIGVALTEIRGEDLGGVFQFNEQGIIGLDYFIRDTMSINLAVQYLHVSSAGLYMPNDGVNTLGCFLGLNWLF
ncbi:MAG: acyloxyacyl hydrolase [Deltaproteobacteria bacterium]|nr:acyloxyacyl hydrolase [Deltaproteobacteria bacterium]